MSDLYLKKSPELEELLRKGRPSRALRKRKKGDYKQKHFFKLPNGQPLRYALWTDWTCFKKTTPMKWWRVYWDVELFKKRKSKCRQPKLGLWTATSGGQHVVCADLDKLPEGHECWFQYRKYLKMVYGPKGGFVLRTYSGKAKLFFVVKVPHGVRTMNYRFSQDALKDILESQELEIAEKSLLAQRETFINPKYAKEFSEWLRKAEVIEFYTKQKRHRFKKDVPMPLVWRVLDDIKFSRNAACGSVKRVLCILMCQPGLLSGFDLPHSKLSKETKLAESCINSVLKRLVKNGMLECTDSGYKVGRYAKTYRALGTLREIMKDLHRKEFNVGENEYSGHEEIQLPKSFLEGTWDEKLWDYSRYFVKKPKVFIAQGIRMLGICFKGRWRKLVRVINNRRKYLGMRLLYEPRTYGKLLEVYGPT